MAPNVRHTTDDDPFERSGSLYEERASNSLHVASGANIAQISRWRCKQGMLHPQRAQGKRYAHFKDELQQTPCGVPSERWQDLENTQADDVGTIEMTSDLPAVCTTNRVWDGHVELEQERDETTRSMHTRAPPMARKYRADIDGLRAVAVIAVVLFHFEPSLLPGGFVGVDIFFVISGFVVTGSLVHKQYDTRATFLLAFYSRRVKRLAPALLVVIALTVLGIATALPPWSPQVDGYYTSASLALVGWANMHFATLPTGYFDEGAAGLHYNPFTHCWSLGVEEQFYLLHPFLILLFYPRRVTKSAAHTPAPSAACAGRASWPSYSRVAPLLLALCAVASAICSAAMTRHTRTLAFYTLPSRAWQLLAGALLFLVHEERLDASSTSVWSQHVGVGAALSLELLATTLTLTALFLTPDGTSTTKGQPASSASSTVDFPWPWSLLAVGGALCTISSGGLPRRRVVGSLHTPLLGRALSHRWLVYIGKLSYPLYLAHWPVLVIFRWTVRHLTAHSLLLPLHAHLTVQSTSSRTPAFRESGEQSQRLGQSCRRAGDHAFEQYRAVPHSRRLRAPLAPKTECARVCPLPSPRCAARDRDRRPTWPTRWAVAHRLDTRVAGRRDTRC